MISISISADMDIEIMSWSLNLYEANEFKKLILDSNLQPSGVSDSSSEFREIYDITKNTFQSAPVFQRSELNSGQILEGPLLIRISNGPSRICPEFNSER